MAEAGEHNALSRLRAKGLLTSGVQLERLNELDRKLGPVTLASTYPATTPSDNTPRVVKGVESKPDKNGEYVGTRSSTSSRAAAAVADTRGSTPSQEIYTTNPANSITLEEQMEVAKLLASDFRKSGSGIGSRKPQPTAHKPTLHKQTSSKSMLVSPGFPVQNKPAASSASSQPALSSHRPQPRPSSPSKPTKQAVPPSSSSSKASDHTSLLSVSNQHQPTSKPDEKQNTTLQLTSDKFKNAIASHIAANGTSAGSTQQHKSVPKASVAPLAAIRASPSTATTSDVAATTSSVSASRAEVFEQKAILLEKKYVELQKRLEELEERREVDKNIGGPDIHAPFLVTVRYPDDTVEKIQACASMRINRFLERALAKKSMMLEVQRVSLTYNEKELGHLSFVGEQDIKEDSMVYITLKPA